MFYPGLRVTGTTMAMARIHLNMHKTILLTMMMFKWGILCSESSDKCLSSPCQNGATCVDTMDDYVCLCPREGVRYTGKDCDQLYDACVFASCAECHSVPGTVEYSCVCPPGVTGESCTEDVNECESDPCTGPRSECMDELNGYSCYCPVGFGGEDCSQHMPDCADQPCLNNGTCKRLPDGIECVCAVGFRGELCEEDIDECASHPCQNGAICLDGAAEYHCFCVPGYQGHNCEIDINECASLPCENNATCINEKDKYVCECLLGYTGVNCEVEIDECESSPCQNGATCHDLVGLYTCDCVRGFEGIDCEVNIDECASEPCLNGGICQDLIDSYECDCNGTGFMGDHCEEDIPECASDPCQHGATCEEGVNQYTCYCWPGFEGENCEVDIDECADGPCQNDGECFEKSEPSHWETDWEFSYASAAGYICQCQPGFTGENCTINIDECQSAPCQNGGTCEDMVNGYVCTCKDGFTGDLCEVNIDECESSPCENGGWCEDGVADYTCHCPEPETEDSLPWGGHHCDVQLLGCVDHACQNGATCQPWIEGDEHGHFCLCQPGFYDEVCSTPTTFSFTQPGFIRVELPEETERRRRDAGQQLHPLGMRLRFRTTLPDMLLFYRGDIHSFLSMEIVGGGLRVRAESEEGWLEVSFSGLVSDGGWRDASVELDENLVLLLKGPGCDNEGCMVEDSDPDHVLVLQPDSIRQVFVGGAPEEYLENTESRQGFVGCMEDLLIDLKPIVPQDLPEDASQDMELGCSKTEWCHEEPDPCSQNGHCVDLWTTYRCDCHRPYHGHDCSQEYPSWTYGHEDSISYSSYEVADSHGSNFSVSMFLRSLRPNSLLLQLRRPVHSEGDELVEESEAEPYFTVYLERGRVFVSSLPPATPLTAPVFLTNGEKQLVEIKVQQGQVFFKHAGLHYPIGELPEVEVMVGDVVYVGGLPEEGEAETWGGHFKGCLQDLRIDSAHLDVDAWNSTTNETVYFSSDVDNVQPGCISDDTCQAEPCLNGGQCTVTWNDFVCSCPLNFTGKMCETRVWCVSDPCMMGSHCVDLPDGYECVTNATFENSPLHYSTEGSLVDAVTSVTMELRTRTENGVLLRAFRREELLLVGLLDANIRVEVYGENSVEPLAFSGERRVADGRWHRVRVFMTHPERKASVWQITVDGIFDGSSAPALAGSVDFLSDVSSSVTLGESFIGCLGAVRVGGVYFPYVDDRTPPQAARFQRREGEHAQVGCVGAPVCESLPCVNGGTCQDLFNLFGCDCLPGWEGQSCELETDECGSQPCLHGMCHDHLAGFDCTCDAGYTGLTCEVDVDDCVDSPCQNGGTCVDGVNHYTCICPPEYSGTRCQWNYPPLKCEVDVQCANMGVCHDTVWGANCTCNPGFTGDRCETDVNECASNPCQNGGSCLDRLARFQCVCATGFSGPLCESNKLSQRERVPWLVVAIPLVCGCILLVIIGLIFMVMTARRKRQSEGAYSPSAQEVAGARLEMDSMLKVPPEERLI
ncbi:protein crumbs homolog 2a [Chanos chanos]|uniref:Protein crumbs homolog 2a n=1 Tax=Chanos chanos TaxID=29144 RepID=A0A6J2UTI3_CHACN|nr:protein crumbs homolog 1-like [Chanos chanos]